MFAQADIFDIPIKDPSELQLSYFWDTADNRESALHFYTLTDSAFQLSAGYTQLSSATSLSSISSDKQLLSIGTDPYQDFSAELTLQNWNADNALEIETTAAKLNFYIKNSLLSIKVQSRQIRLYTIPGAPRDSIKLSSQDLGIGIQYNGIKDWNFAINANKYSYSDNLQLSQIRPIILFYLQPSALSLSSAFEDKNINLSMTHFLQNSQVSVILTKAESATDDNVSKFLTLEWNKNLGQTTAVILSTGQSQSSVINSKSEFYNISLIYYFY